MASPTVQPRPRKTNESARRRVDWEIGGERCLAAARDRLDVDAELCEQERERGRRESRLHDGLLVGEVEHDDVVGGGGDGTRGDADQRVARHAVRKELERAHDLGGRPAAGDREQGVVLASRRHLGRREGIGLARHPRLRAQRSTTAP